MRHNYITLALSRITLYIMEFYGIIHFIEMYIPTDCILFVCSFAELSL